VSLSAADERIRALRPARQRVDPYVAIGATLEPERRPAGIVEQTLTVFLTGAECPFTCSFCDLWRYTIDGPTPLGALARQLRTVLEAHEHQPVDRIKLYNASNFFDPRAVPAQAVGLARFGEVFGGGDRDATGGRAGSGDDPSNCVGATQ